MILAAVLAQPLAPNCASPDRDGWNGPFTSLSCSFCCGCRGNVVLEWELRIDGGSYTAPVARGDAGALYIGDVLGGLVNRQSYCLRARFLDDVAGTGVWGPANGPACSAPAEVCFLWDSAPPAPPAVLDAGVLDAVFMAQLGPGTDVGGGVEGSLIYVDGAGSFEVGVIPGQSPTHPLGPGSWAVQLQAVDRADNRSTLSAPVTVTVVASQQIPRPPAPIWDAPTTNSQYFSARWSGPSNGLWAVQQERNDAGWSVASRPVVVDRVAFLEVGGPCTRTRLRTSRLVDGGASDWSPPSAELLTDRVAPVQSAPTAVLTDAGVLVSWAPAVDSCPSGLSYELERLSDGGSTTLTATSTLLLDVPPVGVSRYRVIAIDGAGNRGTSPLTAPINVVGSVVDAGTIDAGTIDAGTIDAGTIDAGPVDAGPVDAGPVDAGPVDAGPVDAGPVDAGPVDTGPVDAGSSTTQNLRVGCGCSTSDWPGLMLLLLFGRRRQVSTLRGVRSC